MNENIDGVIIRDCKTFPDERGFFREIARFDDLEFVAKQSSHGMRITGVANGLHIHERLNEIFYVSRGVARVVLKDCRIGNPVKTAFVYREPQKVFMTDYGLSETPDAYMEIVLGEHMPKIVKIPAGVAHGYVVLQGECDMVYYADRTYLETRNDEGRIEWNRWPEHDWTREIEVK